MHNLFIILVFCVNIFSVPKSVHYGISLQKYKKELKYANI